MFRRAQSDGDGALGEIVAAIAEQLSAERPVLCLNFASPVVQRLSRIDDDALVGVGIETLYVHSLLAGHHPLEPADHALLNSSMVSLLDRALGGSDE
jgi:molecular chaperone HtpG